MSHSGNNYAVVAVPSLTPPPHTVPKAAASRHAKNDFAWAAKNRDRILAEWSKRYESKAAPK
jgi:iron(III) transport system substrate-binding protein